MIVLIPLTMVSFIATLDQTICSHLAARLSGTARTTAALTSAFHTVFLWTVPFMGFALFLAVAMKEKPLSDEMREVAAGRVEVAQY